MLGERIRLLRTSRGMNQSELANRLGVTKQCVSNWENDNILPSVEMLIRLATFFRVSTDYLLELDGERVVSVVGLTDRQIAHLSMIIDDLKDAGESSHE